MRRKFHEWGSSTSYIEKSSMARLPLGGGLGGREPAPTQKLFNFKALRGCKGAPEADAFQRCGGGGEQQGLAKLLLFGDRQRKGAVEDAAGPQRVDGVHGEGRGFLQFAMLVEPDRAARAAGGGEEGGGKPGDPLQGL